MTNDESRSELIGIASSQVGVQEVGGNNRGPEIVKYQRATWLDPDAWPWCAAFICWCIQQWISKPGVFEIIPTHAQSPETWRPQTAGAHDFNNWAKAHQVQIIPENAATLPGDLVIFDFSHIGMIELPSDSGSEMIHTIEGNTNGEGSRDGGGVYRKTRPRHLVANFIRILPA